MKVPESIGDIYDQNIEEVDRLASRVGEHLSGHLRKEWHFIGRVKERESFALKIETGRFEHPDKLEDFYGCTIVVRTNAELIEAETIINNIFNVQTRRPPKTNFSFSDPSSFEFDHLRLYASWKDDDALPASGLTNRLFEIQIKTYLQHAWSIATHDLIYKTDDVNWRKARIAFQVKAMLEHAEASIAHAEILAAIPELQVENQRLDELREVIKVIKEEWKGDITRLPKDIRRLAESTLTLLRNTGVSPADLRHILEIERTAGGGSLIETLSPYGVILQCLLNRRTTNVRKFATDGKARGRKNKLVFTAEHSYQDKIVPADCQNVLFIKASS